MSHSPQTQSLTDREVPLTAYLDPHETNLDERFLAHLSNLIRMQLGNQVQQHCIWLYGIQLSPAARKVQKVCHTIIHQPHLSNDAIFDEGLILGQVFDGVKYQKLKVPSNLIPDLPFDLLWMIDTVKMHDHLQIETQIMINSHLNVKAPLSRFLKRVCHQITQAIDQHLYPLHDYEPLEINQWCQTQNELYTDAFAAIQSDEQRSDQNGLIHSADPIQLMHHSLRYLNQEIYQRWQRKHINNMSVLCGDVTPAHAAHLLLHTELVAPCIQADDTQRIRELGMRWKMSVESGNPAYMTTIPNLPTRFIFQTDFLRRPNGECMTFSIVGMQPQASTNEIDQLLAQMEQDLEQLMIYPLTSVNSPVTRVFNLLIKNLPTLIEQQHR